MKIIYSSHLHGSLNYIVSFSSSSVLPSSHAVIFSFFLSGDLPCLSKAIFEVNLLVSGNAVNQQTMCAMCTCCRLWEHGGLPCLRHIPYVCVSSRFRGRLAFNKEDGGQLTAKCVKASCLGEQLEGKSLLTKMIPVPLWYKICVIGTGRQTFIHEDVLPATHSHNPQHDYFSRTYPAVSSGCLNDLLST